MKRHRPATLIQLLREGERILKSAGVSAPRQEADLLVSHSLKTSRLQMYLDLERAIAEGAFMKARRLFAQRAKGKPLQYMIGTQEFWGLEFKVTPGVLIPRPETEVLVEEAVRQINQKKSPPDATIWDIGTGCGCIAIALAKALAGIRILATDVSRKALNIARQNARRHGVADRIVFIEGSLLDPLRTSGRVRSGNGRHTFRRADLIVSNPPYISRSELDRLPEEVRAYEPRVALDGGPDGFSVCQGIVLQAPPVLAPGGSLIMEIGHGQASSLREWIRKKKLPWSVQFRRDLSGVDRVAVLTAK